MGVLISQQDVNFELLISEGIVFLKEKLTVDFTTRYYIVYLEKLISQLGIFYLELLICQKEVV